MSSSNNKQTLYTQLAKHVQAMRSIHIRDLFAYNKERASTLSLQLPNIYIDYSKNIVTDETLELLLSYAEILGVSNSINSMFNGEKINTTEQHPALHTALRSKANQQLNIDNTNIVEQAHTELERIKKFTSDIHTGIQRGSTGKPFDSFINIGIGGSDFGPKMVVDALDEFRKKNTSSFFISNIDYQQIDSLIKSINPETSLFIIASKSFTTTETLTNTNTLKEWLAECGIKDVNKHFIAVTANAKAAIDYGISAENIFNIWDWVGGRFSLWSAIGLPIALAVGFDNFKQLLDGAYEVDHHFKTTPTNKNAPIILALLDFWYANFLEAETIATVPYDESLRLLPDYLSQLFMESNGKSTNVSGHVVDYKTMPIAWGSTGTDAQHSFFQLLHQGTHLVPIEFLAPLKKKGNQTHHKLLLANCFAQSQALMQGESNSDAHRHFPGNKPSTTILYSELTPRTLGSLLAMYEHRTFVQGLLWEVNSFDQLGVELGKRLAKTIYENLEGIKQNNTMDSSTRTLIKHYKNSLD